MKVSDKTAVIIGGGAGIGAAIARELGRHACRVVVADIDGGKAENTARDVSACGGQGYPFVCDLGDPASLDGLLEFVDANFAARLDLLFNHAGVSAAGLLEAIPDDAWNRVLSTNVTGFAGAISRFLPLMGSDNPGWIVNTSSSLGLFHDIPFAAPYIASKAAIIAYSRALATYVSGRNLGVSVLCPDITDTQFATSPVLYGIDPAIAEAARPTSMQSPEEVAQAAIGGIEKEQFLISLSANAEERLASMAAANLDPGSDRLAADNAADGILQIGTLRLARDKREKALSALVEMAGKSRQETGCMDYLFSVDPEDDLLVHLREIWVDQQAMDAHAGMPHTRDFMEIVGSLGLSDFSTSSWPIAT